MASAFLRQVFAPSKTSMRMAWLLDVASVFVFVGQAYVLVRILGGWLTSFVADVPLPERASGLGLWVNLGLLFGCMVARIGIGYLKDDLLTKVGLDVATSVRGRLLHKLGKLGQDRRDWVGHDVVFVRD